MGSAMPEARMEHGEVVRRLRAVAARLDLVGTAAAFLASLGSAPLRYRPVLGHLAYAKNFPEHGFVPSRGEQNYLCQVCGLELLGPVMPAALKALGHATSLPDARGLPERGYRLVAARNLLYLLKTLQTPSLAPEQI